MTMRNRNPGRRTHMLLDGDWLFQIDRHEKGESFGWHLPEYQDEDWLPVEVPGSWDCYLPELWGYSGTAWFRRAFRVRKGWGPPETLGDGHRIILRFEGANYATSAWLNGQDVGHHEGGFDPFEFDITGQLDWQGENMLVVRVDNWPKINRIPNSYAGWWNYGGIYRSVRLLALPAVRIADVFIHPEPVVDGKPLQVEVTLANEGRAPARLGLSGMLISEEASLDLPGQRLELAPGQVTTLTLQATLEAPRLWSPETPHLYLAELTLHAGRKILDRQHVEFGIRKFEVRGKQLFLNNQPIFLTGFDRHEEYIDTGRVDNGRQLIQDLEWIQRMNGKMVRMHYQAHPNLYELCDQMGLLVFAEIPFWQVGIKDAKEWENPSVWQTAEAMLRTLVHDLKNHPSVVIWSVGNECATNLPEARPLVGHMVDLVKSLDASRPVAMVGMFGPKDMIYDLVDLPCLNTYFFHDQEGLRQRLEGTHALTPEKPLLITEFGAEAILDLHGEGYGSEEEQASILEDHWKVFQEKRDYIAGALIWCLADYWHMPMAPDFRWGLNRYFFTHGLLSLDRLPKVAVEAAARLFGEVNP